MKQKLLTLLILAVMSLSASAAYVVVTGTNVRLRMSPSLKSETLTNSKGENIHPAKGEKLELLGESGDFYKVRYKGQVVYISKQFSTKSETSTTTSTKSKTANGQKYVVVTGTGVRLRLQPSLKAATMKSGGNDVHPVKGERIKLMGEEGDFYKVNYQGNYVYIHKDYARPD